jgi:hypothetical protein
MLSRLIAPKLRNDIGMKRDALQRRLQRAESLAQRLAENVAFQRQMIATLEQDGHDVEAAKMFLRRLESAHGKHVAERDQLFKELANHS